MNSEFWVSFVNLLISVAVLVTIIVTIVKIVKHSTRIKEVKDITGSVVGLKKPSVIKISVIIVILAVIMIATSFFIFIDIMNLYINS